MTQREDAAPNIAIFADFENVALGVRDANVEPFNISLVLERLLDKGKIVVKKAYADWDRYKSHKRSMHEAAFELVEIPHIPTQERTPRTFDWSWMRSIFVTRKRISIFS